MHGRSPQLPGRTQVSQGFRGPRCSACGGLRTQGCDWMAPAWMGGTLAKGLTAVSGSVCIDSGGRRPKAYVLNTHVIYTRSSPHLPKGVSL